MGYVSRLPSNILIIDDSTDINSDVVTPKGVGKGYCPRDLQKTPVGSFGAPFPYKTFTRQEIIDRIRDNESQGETISEIADARGVKRLDQAQTNYCWANAVISGIHNLRAQQGMTFQALSPASVAAPIRGFANQGGFGAEAYRYIMQNGVNLQTDWPANAIDSRLYNAQNREKAKKNMILEGYELEPNNVLQLFTALVMGFCVPVALMWWSHEVCMNDPKVIGNNTLAALGDNSWGTSYGTNGRMVLEESRLVAADQIAIRSVSVF